MNIAIPVPAIKGHCGRKLAVYQTSLGVMAIASVLTHDPRADRWNRLDPELKSIYEKLQRKTTKARRTSARRYLTDRMVGPKVYWIGAWPSLAIGVCAAQEFVPFEADRNGQAGTLWIDSDPENHRILLDGLARYTAAMDAATDPDDPETKKAVRDMAIPVTIYASANPDEPLTLDELAQLFHDFNVLGVPVGKGHAIDLDKSDIYIQFVNRMCEFDVIKSRGGVDARASRLSAKGENIATKAVLLKFARAAIEGPGAHVDHIRDEITDGKLVTSTMSDHLDEVEMFIERLALGMGDRFSAKSHLHLSNPGWVALGLVYHDLFEKLARSLTVAERDAFIDKIAALDWSPANEDFLGFLAEPLKDANGAEVLDAGGRRQMGRFYGGAKAYSNLADYIREKVGLKPLLEKETPPEPSSTGAKIDPDREPVGVGA